MIASAAWFIRQKPKTSKLHALTNISIVPKTNVYCIGRRIDYMPNWDPTEVKWIETFQIGSSDITDPLTDIERKSQLDNINRELRYAMLLSIETNIKQIECDNNIILHQWSVYHLGYKNRPPGK